VDDARLFDLQTIADDRGRVIVAEGNALPFAVARAFAVVGTPDGAERGHHAHRQCNQVLTALAGSLEVRLDDGSRKRTVTLTDPAQALHVPPGLWSEQVYHGNPTTVMVYCDRPFDETDYLRDYQTYLAWRRERLAVANPANGPLRLNLGCGGRPLPGYVNVDMDTIEQIRRRYPDTHYPDDIIIEQFDVFDLPFADGTVDEVRADSFLEHLGFADEPRFFNEAIRVLKRGGRLNICVPDFEALCHIWLAAKDDWKDFYRNDPEAIATSHWFGTYSWGMENRWGYLGASLYGNQCGGGQFHANYYTEAKLRAICARFNLTVEKVEYSKWKGDRDPMVGIIAVRN
jgi:predicted SAM-dependent methyltransferase/dTDP-4-dehydrorhamnose 3,5-epimerase-like enzyme